ncbi:MAG: hypothetical protein IKP46_05725 [Bacteroidales bacterium]|nr:hypothetical protein [Bacteroidales bacterium]
MSIAGDSLASLGMTGNCRVVMPRPSAESISMQRHFLLAGAFDAPLAHFLVGTYVGLGELTALAEKDVDPQSQDTEPDKENGCEENLHPYITKSGLIAW